jgi:ERCC4-type nuclease
MMQKGIVNTSKAPKRRTLITSPLAWQMTSAPVSHPPIPVLAERGGTQLKAPRGVVLVDTREQCPFDFSRFAGWFAGVEKKALFTGDYTIAGLEDTCIVERKDLSDLVHSFTVERSTFIHRLRRMSTCPHRLLVITTALSQIKTPYLHSGTNPNRILQSLIAVLSGLGVPFVTTETHELGEEVVASYLYQVHLYDWLEKNDFGRFLADGDL